MIEAAKKLPRALRAILFHLLQLTWCLPQNLLGAAAALVFRGKRYRYHGSLVTLYRGEKRAEKLGAFSLSAFIFIPETWSEDYRRSVAVHEYGHVVQSLMLGPLYLPVVGLPSVIWSRRFGKHYSRYRTRGVGYTDRFPENSADRLGERYTGESAK
ncbi:MAG: hypothetical protein J5586_06765 [Clostridia bacterium]|nr:hypothetical protein [Clostridia bacterium]